MAYSYLKTSMQNPKDVEAKCIQNAKWLDFTSLTEGSNTTTQILINDPLILFKLRVEVEKLIKHYMEE